MNDGQTDRTKEEREQRWEGGRERGRGRGNAGIHGCMDGYIALGYIDGNMVHGSMD